MASFQAPPGHLCQQEVAILARMLGSKLTMEAPDADLKVGDGSRHRQSVAAAGLGPCSSRGRGRRAALPPARAAALPLHEHAAPPPFAQVPQLTTPEGHKVAGTMAVVRAGESLPAAARDCVAGLHNPLCPRVSVFPAAAACRPPIAPPPPPVAGDAASLCPPERKVRVAALPLSNTAQLRPAHSRDWERSAPRLDRR